MTEPVLSVSNLAVSFATEAGPARAVDGISFEVMPGETLGLVGESGCGKSVTSLALMGLIEKPAGRVDCDSLRLAGRELTGLQEPEWRRVRGKDISMIFQEPMTALNPVFTVGSQLTEVLRRHQKLKRAEAAERAVDLLHRVGIPSPEKRIRDYPHELSGGMRQRVMIAMAISCEPKVLIADEPTTALDVTTQAQVLEQIMRLQETLDTAVVLITHDLGIVAETCQRTLVMYCGKIVEEAPVDALFHHPRHPYTAGLLAAVPRLRGRRIARLPTIPGSVPDPTQPVPGCRFEDRCEYAQPECRDRQPGLLGSDTGHGYACHFPLQGRAR